MGSEQEKEGERPGGPHLRQMWVMWSSPDLETPEVSRRAAEVAAGKGGW